MTTPEQTILVVEDDEMVRQFITLHLETEGYGVRTAATGAKMIEALSDQRPDLILLDLNLPDGDGLSLAREVRQHSNIPIIIATTRKSREDRLMGLGIGVDDYLTKPFDPTELTLRVRNVLKRCHGSDPSSRQRHPDTIVAPIQLPSPVIEMSRSKSRKTDTYRGRVFLTSALAAAGAAVTVFWLSTDPVQTVSEPVMETQVMADKPSPRFLPAPDQTEEIAQFHTSAGGREIADETPERPLAELLGHGWALNSRCDPVPQVKWWKFKTHESIAAYVNRKHDGNWTNYAEIWLRRLAKLQDIYERESSAVTRTGVVLKDDALKAYLGQIRERLGITQCLAGEAKLYAASNVTVDQ
jgi:DNA-binding response OmpR family regulator